MDIALSHRELPHPRHTPTPRGQPKANNCLINEWNKIPGLLSQYGANLTSTGHSSPFRLPGVSLQSLYVSACPNKPLVGNLPS